VTKIKGTEIEGWIGLDWKIGMDKWKTRTAALLSVGCKPYHFIGQYQNF